MRTLCFTERALAEFGLLRGTYTELKYYCLDMTTRKINNRRIIMIKDYSPISKLAIS